MMDEKMTFKDFMTDVTNRLDEELSGHTTVEFATDESHLFYESLGAIAYKLCKITTSYNGFFFSRIFSSHDIWQYSDSTIAAEEIITYYVNEYVHAMIDRMFKKGYPTDK